VQRSSAVLAGVFALALASNAIAGSEIGFLGGLNRATFHETPQESGLDFATRNLFLAGGVLNLGLGGRFSLRIEPMFCTKGSTVTIDIFGAETATVRLSYLELPVLLNVSLSSGAVRPYLIAGPTLGYLTSATGTDSTGSKTDIKKNFKKADPGISFGGGLRMRGRPSFFVEARYTLGLANIAKDSQGFSLKNRGLQLAAGLTFPLGRR
jgi:hypothetical protein